MLGYSPISAIDRIIEPCPHYDKFFDKPKTGELKRKVLSADADVEQTVDLMLNVINKHYKEVEKAKHLVKGANTWQTAKKIFNFIYNHIKYNLEPGEILHTPAAVYWHGQVMARQNSTKTSDYPIDCDDMAIMACSFLKALHLPWSLRIASYDGKKYGHVYCVVPQRNSEIIIDPVYIGFNLEKPYKMQKTFVGSTEGMAGIPVYLQSVNGLSGFGSESMGMLTGLLSGSGLSGLGNGPALSDYLKKTLIITKQHPELVQKTYKNPYVFEKMLQRAIGALNTKEESEILDILEQQEKQFINEAKAMSGFASDNDWYVDEFPEDQELSGLSYRNVNGIKYFNVGNLGFFGRLNLLRKLKTKIAQIKLKKPNKITAKAARKSNRALKMLNKANPVLRPVMQPVKPIVIAPFKPAIIPKPIQKAVIVTPTKQAIIKPVQKPVVMAPVKPAVIQPIREDESYPDQEYESDLIQEDENYPVQESDQYTNETEPENESYEYEPEETEDSEENTDEIIEGLAGGKHFQLSGLGAISDNQAIKRYLKDTLKVVKSRPNIAKSVYKNPYMFQNMLNRAIAGLEADEESEILDILAEQEKEQLNKPLSGFESDLYYIDGIGTIDFGGLGLFGRLGLFKKLKEKHRTKKIARLEKKGKTAKIEKYKGKIVKRDKRAEKVKKVFQNVARVFNKVNPVTVAARNGLRLLIALNFFGLASKLSENKEAADKVRELFKKMGGKEGNINKSIINGSKKKPLMKKDGSVKTLEGFEGLGELGAIVAMNVILKAAGKIVEKIFTWFKTKAAERKQKKAIESGEAPEAPALSPENESEQTITEDTQPLEVQQDKPKFFKKAINFAKENLFKPSQEQQEQSEGEKSLTVPVIQNQSLPSVETLPISQNMTKNASIGGSKIVMWAAGIAGIAAIAYFARTRPKPQYTSMSGYKKLSGIKLK